MSKNCCCFIFRLIAFSASNRYRDPGRTNLGTQFGRSVQLAGIGTIEKPFIKSRSTEVYNTEGAKKESLWIGHSVKVALESYLMVTDEDYSLAAKRKITEPVDKVEGSPELKPLDSETL